MASSQNISVFRQALSRLGYLSSTKDENAPLDTEDRQAMQRALADLGPIMGLDVSKGYTPAIGQSIVDAVAAKRADPKVTGALEAYSKGQGFDAESFMSAKEKTLLEGVKAVALIRGNPPPQTKFTHPELSLMLKNDQKFSDTLLQNIQGVRHLFEGNNAKDFVSAVNEIVPDLAGLETVKRSPAGPQAGAAATPRADAAVAGVSTDILRSLTLKPEQYLSPKFNPNALAAARAATATTGPAVLVEHRTPDGRIIRIPVTNYNASSVGTQQPAAPTTTGEDASAAAKTDSQKTDSGPAEENFVYEAQTRPPFLKNSHVEQAQKSMLEFAALQTDKLVIDLGKTGPKKDGVDGDFRGKTKAAVIATQELLYGKGSDKIDGKITSEFLTLLNRKILELKTGSEFTTDAGTGAPAATGTGTPAPTTGTDAPAATGAGAGTTPAPTAPKVDKAVLAAASQTAEASLKKIVDMLGASAGISAPGPVDGDFDAQSVKSGEEALALLVQVLGIPNPSGKYSPALGATLKQKINENDGMRQQVDVALGVGGFDKMIDAFDTLNKAEKFGTLTTQFQGAAQRFPKPDISQQQGNLLAWMVGRDAKTSVFTNELLRLYGGYGIEDLFPAKVPFLPGLKRDSKLPELPPIHEHSKRVAQVFKDMLDSGMSLADIQKNLIKETRPEVRSRDRVVPAAYSGSLEALVQVSGDTDRSHAFRVVLLNSFKAAEAAAKPGASNENIAQAFDKALRDNWEPVHAKHNVTFQKMDVDSSRKLMLAASASDAFPGEKAERNGTGEPMGYVDLFHARNVGRRAHTQDPVSVKADNGDIKIIIPGPETNILSVETITAKELVKMQEIVMDGVRTPISGDILGPGRDLQRGEWAAIHGALAKCSSAYNVIMQEHGYAVLNNDPVVFMETLVKSKTIAELRTELNGNGTPAPVDAQNVDVKPGGLPFNPAAVGLPVTADQHTAEQELKGTVHKSPGMHQ